MAELKTKPTDASVDEFLAGIADPGRREDACALCRMMAGASGAQPVMWGATIVGFGAKHLKYASGRELDWLVIGFSPRKANLVAYLMDGFEAHRDLLARLGPHRTGVGCLYLKRLSGIDQDVLAELIALSVRAVKGR